MHLCRFDEDRLGLLDGDEIVDVSEVLDELPAVRWPLPLGDLLIARLAELQPRIAAAAKTGRRLPRASVKLTSPVANPSKIIGAPVNYQKHLEEAQAATEINFGREIKTIDYYGLFLKANSSLVGPDDGIALRFLDRRNDHELELAVIIGRGGTDIPEERAMEHVAGYAVALDMTVRGSEDRSQRKSVDSYAVLGPALVTADEINDPGNLEMSLEVNGELRQKSNTSNLIFGVPHLIAYASRNYNLYPGDIIMTGTPEGVAPVAVGDRIVARIEGLGELQVVVRAH